MLTPSATFWHDAATALLSVCRNAAVETGGNAHDFADWRVVVSTFAHVQQLKSALSTQINDVFIPPQIGTLSGWLNTLPPLSNITSASERLMRLYAELRQHSWLKKLFTAHRNIDLLPLAHTLLLLCDELTQALLPSIHTSIETDVTQRWQNALEQLSPSARQLLSDETQLVWSIWKSQLDADDVIAARFIQMLQLTQHTNQPLIWISSVAPDALEQAFLHAYANRQSVFQITLDWRREALTPAYAAAWPELLEDATDTSTVVTDQVSTLTGITLCSANSVEDEAVQGAQTIIDWLQSGKTRLAIVAQDRVVARRIRALLERAQIDVTDETGWKLSTTRAASALAAWFELVTTRGQTSALLDFLKSPFVLNDALHSVVDNVANKSMLVMKIELTLRRANVLGEWHSVLNALDPVSASWQVVAMLARQAELFAGRKTLNDWVVTTFKALDTLGMTVTLDADAAGQQICQLLHNIVSEEREPSAVFSLSEWRALVNLQLDTTSFVTSVSDRRVVMLPLNGARLRTFDAVLVVGADAEHLPSQPQETLFFANAVRRELGLATRESRQRQQLRDLTELLSMNPQVVLSWQAYRDGESVPVSPWLERLQLTLMRAAAAPLPQQRAVLPYQNMQQTLVTMPAPVAPQLIPTRLSASGYNSFVACPYQFFVKRMLGLVSLDELSDLPEKRDYGDWLHHILAIYHETIRDQQYLPDQRHALLIAISENFFNDLIAKNAAVLGYYTRWQKVIASYLTWAHQREALGWQFVSSEQAYEKLLSLPSGDLLLHGRIDRIDQNEAGERAVLDYKTSNLAALNKKIKEHEDHQLAFYGLLSDVPIKTAHYVALDGKIGDVEAPAYDEAQQALANQIALNMQAIANSVGLPANGVGSVCQYCDVRGLCRKGAW